jgi:hypothetical protein
VSLYCPEVADKTVSQVQKVRVLCTKRLLGELAEFALELGNGLEEIGNEPVIGDLKNRRLLVLVDGDDDLGVLIPARCWMAPEIPTAI